MFIEHLEGESRGSQLETAQMAKLSKSVSVCVGRGSGTERKGRKEGGRQQSVIIIVAVTIISKYNSMAVATAAVADDSDQAFGGVLLTRLYKIAGRMIHTHTHIDVDGTGPE